MSESRTRFLVALLGAVAFSIESWALGPYSWMYAFGSGVETLPLNLALHFDERLFSAWSPFIAGGLDRYGFAGGADPLNWESLFIALFPPWLANGLHRFIQYFIAIYFTTVLCRKQLGLDARYSLLGGVFYACFSYFTFGELLGIPALPLFLLLMQRLHERSGNLLWSLPVGLAFSTFTTFPHTVPYLALFAAAWSALVLRDVSARAVAIWGLMVAGLGIGDLPQLLSPLANGPFSQRAALPPEIISWSVSDLFYRQLRFDYFNQDVFTQVIVWDLPLPLLTAGAVAIGVMRLAQGRSTPQGSAYLRVYSVYFLLSQRWLFVAAQNFVGHWIPWIGGIYMGRFFDVPASLLIACQLAMLVSMLMGLLGTQPRARIVAQACVLAFVAFMLVRPKVFLAYRIGVEGWGQFNYQVKSLDRLMKAETEPFRVASVLPLQPAYAYAQGFETVDGWANLYPRVYREYWHEVMAPLFKNAPKVKSIFAPDVGRPQDHFIFLGVDLVNPTFGAIEGEDPVRAVAEGFDVDKRFNLKLLGIQNVKYLLSEFPLKSAGLKLVHAPADPPKVPYSRDWATGRISIPAAESHGRGVLRKIGNTFVDLRDAVERKSRGKDVFIYQVEEFLQRFRFATEVRMEPTGRKVLDKLAQAQAKELQSVAYMERGDTSDAPSRRFESGQVVEIKRRSSEVDIRLECHSGCFLVAAMTWSPFWKAEIDGKPYPVVRANHTQLGISIPANASRLTLRYVPPYLPF